MSELLAALKYLRTLLFHKLCVLLCGIWINWKLCGSGLRLSFHRLLFHDWVKFTPAEFLPYARKFFGEYQDAEKKKEVLEKWEKGTIEWLISL